MGIALSTEFKFYRKEETGYQYGFLKRYFDGDVYVPQEAVKNNINNAPALLCSYARNERGQYATWAAGVKPKVDTPTLIAHWNEYQSFEYAVIQLPAGFLLTEESFNETLQKFHLKTETKSEWDKLTTKIVSLGASFILYKYFEENFE